MHDKGHLQWAQVVDDQESRGKMLCCRAGVYDGIVRSLQGNNTAKARDKYRDCSIFARKTAVRNELVSVTSGGVATKVRSAPRELSGTKQLLRDAGALVRTGRP